MLWNLISTKCQLYARITIAELYLFLRWSSIEQTLKYWPIFFSYIFSLAKPTVVCLWSCWAKRFAYFLNAAWFYRLLSAMRLVGQNQSTLTNSHIIIAIGNHRWTPFLNPYRVSAMHFVLINRVIFRMNYVWKSTDKHLAISWIMHGMCILFSKL